MKGMRLGREKTGSSEGKKKRVDKLIKQKNKGEKQALDQGDEIAGAAPYFVDALCETVDLSVHNLSEKLLGYGQVVYVGAAARGGLEWLDEPSDTRWGILGTVTARRSDKLSAEEHQALLDSYCMKPGICAIITGVEYGKPPHGETKPCAHIEDQRMALEIHAKMALKLKLPLILVLRPEAREAEESDKAVQDALTWLSESGVPDDYKILFSSWQGTPKMALTALKRFKNASLSLNAAVTFRSASHLREIAFDTPLDRLMLESSAPTFPPMNQTLPHSPWTLLTVMQCVAEQRRCTVDDLLIATNANAAKFFNKTLRTIEVPTVEAVEASVTVAAAPKVDAPVQVKSDDRAGDRKEKDAAEESEEDLEELKRFLE